jgi:hypothetical protein
MRRGWGAAGIAVAIAVAAFAASSYPACAVYDSSLIGSREASTDELPLDKDAGPACMPAHPPGRPVTADDGGVSPTLPPIVAAFNTIDIGVSGGPDAGIPPFGYDLDDTCTCPGPPSCLQPLQPNGSPASKICDDDQGRDHTSIPLFQLLQLLGGPAAMGINQIDQGLTAGQYGLLLVISDYNGKQDDSRVRVDFYVSNGLKRDADGGIPTPKLDGTDLWTIDPQSLPGGQPAFSDDSAYVTGGAVVAHMSQLPIAFGDRSFLGGATMQLFGAVIVGELQAQTIADSGTGGFGFALSGGTIAGRWPTSQILSTLATIPEEGGFLCGSDPAYKLNYNIVKGVVCQVADIAKVQSEDNTTPLAPCDAISVGMEFTAVPAQVGPILGVPPAPSGCQDGGFMWSDQCPP